MPMHVYCANNEWDATGEIAHLLLSQFAVTCYNNQGELASDVAYKAACTGIHEQPAAIIKLLSDSSGWSSLMFAAARRDLQEVTCCLRSNGSDPWLQCTLPCGTVYDATSLASNQHEWSLPMCEAASEIIGSSMYWCEESHNLFPRNFRRGVWHVCMLQVALRQVDALPLLPDVLWHLIISHLPRSWEFL